MGVASTAMGESTKTGSSGISPRDSSSRSREEDVLGPADGEGRHEERAAPPCGVLDRRAQLGHPVPGVAAVTA